MDAQKMWEEACGLLKRRINEVSYKTYIASSLEVDSCEDGVFTLVTDADYIRTWIENRYINDISECLVTVIGKPVRVRVMLKDVLQKEKAEKAAKEAPVAPQAGEVKLNPRYTFDTFVVGSANRFAHAAAVAVADKPALAYNPLFIYGGVGLGKTHLMQAIAHEVKAEHPEMKLCYTTSEEFTNDLINSIKTSTNTAFRERYRGVDVLLVDDIQFIAGREQTQEEFFNTFNALYEANKQIVMTSDRPPKEIAHLEERLRSRFEGGLLADISRYDIDTRAAILRKKAEAEKWAIGDDVLELIAERVDSNIRDLEGNLTRLNAYANLVQQPVTVAMAQEVLKDSIGPCAPIVVNAERVIKIVADYYSIDPSDIVSQSRRREVAAPRQMAMYLTREMCDLSLPQIGVKFGGRDHTTVLYSINQVAKQVKTSADMMNLVKDLQRRIKEGR